uniref:Uncharacterized protein n=1 Tax=Latimeria chalumnae TaxID=7897 RepID=H3B3A4_LATCH
VKLERTFELWLLVTCKSLNSLGPKSISDLLTCYKYVPSHHQQPNNTGLLVEPNYHLMSRDYRAFSSYVPQLCNSL